MRIVVSHLTRMKHPYICVAGLDLDDDNHRHVRPTLGGSQLHKNLLKSNGGPFDIGAVVDLGSVCAEGTPPEVEDRQFSPERARFVEGMEPLEFWKHLSEVSQERLQAIFGTDLQRRSQSAMTSEGQGRASLGCLKPSGKTNLFVNDGGKLRMIVEDGELRSLDLSVSDVRLYNDDLSTVNLPTFHDVQERIKNGVPLLLSVGLTRAWSSGTAPRRHWLQVNGIHLEDDPLWSTARAV